MQRVAIDTQRYIDAAWQWVVLASNAFGLGDADEDLSVHLNLFDPEGPTAVGIFRKNRAKNLVFLEKNPNALEIIKTFNPPTGAELEIFKKVMDDVVGKRNFDAFFAPSKFRKLQTALIKRLKAKDI